MATCSLSGEVATEPVLSPKSGHIFEKRLIEKYVNDTGKDPVSNESLSIDELIAVKSTKTVKPRAPTATSVPALLAAFQNEWDSVVLETYSLKLQLEQARQELSHSLYQHEAACRVIARLVKERDAARASLASFQPQAASDAAAAPLGDGMDVDVVSSGQEKSLPATLLTLVESNAKTLQKSRRKRALPGSLASQEQVAQYKQKSSTSALHSASSSGITSLDISPNGAKVLTGGVDKNVVVYNIADDSVQYTLKGHTKRITSAIFHPTEDIIFSASQDKTFRAWHPDASKGYKSEYIVKSHKSDVTDLSIHPTGKFIASASLDSTWTLTDINDGSEIFSVSSPAVTKGLTKAQFHPDGLLLATGTVESVVQMWDIKTVANVASFDEHKAKITDLAFSENGFYFATAAEDSVVKVWDLRVLKTVHNINLGDGKIANALDFDYSGSYLGVAAGSGLKVFNTKTWEEIVQLNDHTGPVTDIKFGKDASTLVSVSLDRTLRFYGL